VDAIMPTFTGTNQSDSIVPGSVSAGVIADPAGSLPGDGADTIYGNAGNDILGGGAGNDSLSGGGGADNLFGGNGNDMLLGDAGDDVLQGSNGNDTLTGGTGDDRYYLSDASDIVQEAFGGGIDTVHAGFDITLGANVENLILDGAVTGYGNSLDNSMTGDFEATLKGGAGNDTYEIEEYDSISIVEMAGEGTDTVNMSFVYSYDTYYYDHSYVIPDNVENLNVNDAWRYNRSDGSLIYQGSEAVGNDAANVIRGGEGDNTIFGGGGADTLYGNAGSDTLEGGGGGDRLEGGDGYDYLEGGGGTDHLDGGALEDTVLYTSNTTPVRVDLASGLASFPGQSWGSETLVSIENAQGGSGDDIFIGSSVANEFRGNDGDDTFDGGGGRDTFYGGAGSDTVLYTSNTTSVNVNLGLSNVSFPGQSWPSEHVSMIENASTGSAADTLTGSTARNELHGMDGADRLAGGRGADRLVGGAGNDVFVFTADTSMPGTRDTIAPGDGRRAFQGAGAADGDRIDVSGYDADTTTAGMQDWVFGASHAKGHLWMTTSGNQTILNGNADDDAAIEFQVAIADAEVAASTYTAQDFIL
jgi:Ca2+-binding RTX toxin-like protein